LGAIRFVLFYFVCGLAAGALQIAVNPVSTVPNLGASGAIAGVLGAFLVEFPHDRILVAILVPFWIAHTRISAGVLIGIWFVLQLIGGVGSITATAGGVAYFAHIGGFIAGVVLIKLFGAGRRTTGEYDFRQQRG
ncbi:MAG TPA: rhomboid family intramembrane serine protease, partial [bacterium]|nr:rhomboid family intramembrane serine protease [bacterium]